MSLSRTVRACVPLLLLVSALVAPHAQAQPQQFRFHYVASSTGAWSDAPDGVPLVNELHPLGHFSFSSPGRTFELMFDDSGTLTAATIPVDVHIGGTWTHRCVHARTPVRFFGSARGADVLVFVSTTGNAALRCTGTGTTGTAYVTP
ncbi:MAG: hypothetical protein QOE05_973 [Actinomycetota bacterium]|jgi:hypothetical protein|nr:hypothetical protein [Actinomycetota bacterium]